MIAKLQYISQETNELTHIQAIEKALDAGCQWVQLRVKNQSEAVVFAQAETAKKLCENYQAKLIINDFPKVAKAVAADGLHLGLQDMPLPEARKLVGENMFIGGTANTLEDVLQRVKEGADYVGLGPFRFTSTKEKLSPVLGLAGYAAIMNQLKAAGISLPVIAIGGLELADVPALLEIGVHGIAVSGALTHAADPGGFVRKYQELCRPIPLTEVNGNR